MLRRQLQPTVGSAVSLSGLEMTARRFQAEKSFKEQDSREALGRGERDKLKSRHPPLQDFRFNYQRQEEPMFEMTHWLGEDNLISDGLVVEKRLSGIPFHVGDAAALDYANRHHKTQVRPVAVDRFLLPFWLATTRAWGVFKADVYQRDPSALTKAINAWVKSPNYEFDYPLGEHLYFNQFSASYFVAPTLAEGTLVGGHIPSMLIERYELLEELEEMATLPTFVPFESTTATVKRQVAKVTTKERVQVFANRELLKYHGNFVKANFHFLSLGAEMLKIRPVYLPLYRLMCCTSSNMKPVPTYICGATGKTVGPVIHVPKSERFYMGLATGAVAASIFSIHFTPEICAMVGLIGAVGIQQVVNWYRYAEVLKTLGLEQAEVLSARTAHAECNTRGWKWSVQEEEKAEYEYREFLRARARRRAEFQQRVQEETEREESMNAGKAYQRNERKRASPRRKTTDPDPLSYYRVLGLKGKESTSTAKDIARSFRLMAAKHHPDLVTDESKKEKAHKEMQRLLEAYNILRDKKLRQEYDSGKMSFSQ